MKYSDQYMMKDFYNRTFSVLDQYDSVKANLGEESYEVTLLINCLFGIIIMPNSYWFKKIKDIKFSKNIPDVMIKVNGKKRDLANYKVNQIFNNIRNSIAHWGDMRLGENYGYENIVFEDKDDKISGLKIINKQNSFEIYFKTIDSIREFLNELKEIINN